MLRTKDVLHVRPLVDGQMYRGCPLTAIPLACTLLLSLT
jgi:hypothetical protein